MTEVEKAFRNPLKKFFTAAAEHAVTMAKAHAAKMEKCEEDSADHVFHKTGMTAHTAFGETCVECAKDSGAMLMSRKAAGMGDDLDALMPLPDGLSTLAPDPRLVRAVPRYGMREVPTAAPDSVFSKMFDTETGEA